MAHRDLLIGSELAGYRVESVVGRGGMGTVYLAEHVGLGRKVALKVLSPELAASDDFRLRFARESRVAASLDHPHVVPIYEAGEANGVLFIAMRFVDGTDLATLLRGEGALAAGRVAAIVSQVGSALDAAHAKGLVHRDVKPGNVLITRADPDEDVEDYAYLSDFGLTRLTSSDSALTRTGQFMGTVAYAAPEQFQGRPSDAATDLYSLGCVAYECLAGERPYPREQEAAVMFGHLQEDPPRPSKLRPELPPEVDDVIAKAMAKAPEHRFASGRAMGAALRAALGGEPSVPPVSGGPGVRVRPPPAGHAAPTFPGPARTDSAPAAHPRRRRALLAALVAVAVVGAAVVAIALSVGSSDKGAGSTPSASASGGPSSSASGGPSSSASGAPPGLPIAVDTVVKLDPASGEVLAGYPVGSNPEAIAYSGGAVWVVNDGDQTISHIDASTGTVTAKGGIESPCAVFPARGGGVWVTSCSAGVVQLVDPDSLTVTRRIDVQSPQGVLEAAGSLWIVSNRGRFERSVLERFTPSGHLQAKITVGPDSGAIAATDDGTLWGTDHGDGTIWHVDPATNSVEFFPGWTGPTSITAEGSTLWITDDQQNSVTQWDTIQHQAIGLVRDQQGVVVVTPGAVWIQDGFFDNLTKVDPRTDQVVNEYQLGFSSYMVEGGGSLWISAGQD